MTESAIIDRGRMLAERLGMTIIGLEGHDLKGPCPACSSSDAFRLHSETGVAQCYSCGSKWSPYALAESHLGKDAALALLVELGIFEDRPRPGGNGQAESDEAGFLAVCVAKRIRGQHTLYGGVLKGSKSLTADELAIALAAGVPWLGYFEVPRPVRTILLSGESGWPVLQENIRRISRALSADGAKLEENLLVGVKLPKFGRPDFMLALQDTIRKTEAEVAILDCAYRCIPGDNASNLFAMGELLDSAGRVFEECGATLVLLHHSPKHIPPGEPLQLDNPAFAGFAEFAAGWILLNRQQPYEPGTGHHDLWLTIGARAGIGGTYALTIDEGQYHAGQDREWRVAVSRADEARQERREQRERDRETKEREKQQADLEAARAAAVAAMVKLGKPEGREEVIDRTPIQRKRAIRAWASLVDDRTILPAGDAKKRNGHAYPIYRVETNWAAPLCLMTASLSCVVYWV